MNFIPEKKATPKRIITNIEANLAFEDNISLVIDFLYALYLIILHLYHSICSIESGFLFTSILLTFASLIFITLSAIWAIAELWVITITVVPVFSTSIL